MIDLGVSSGDLGRGGSTGVGGSRASFPAVLMAGQWPCTGRPSTILASVSPDERRGLPSKDPEFTRCARHVGLSSLDNQMSAEVQVWAFIETAKGPNLRAGDTEFHLQTQRSRQTLLSRLNPSLPTCRAWPRILPQSEAGLSFHRDVFRLVLNSDN